MVSAKLKGHEMATKKAATKKAVKPLVKKATKKVAPPAPKVAPSRGSDNEELITKITDLRGEGMKFADISKELGIAGSRIQFLYETGQARLAGNVKKATPAAILKERDENMLSWVQIAAKFGITKAVTQRLYREAGGDPHTSVIGKGGRYGSFEDATAKARAKASAERKGEPTPKATKKVATKKVAPAPVKKTAAAPAKATTKKAAAPKGKGEPAESADLKSLFARDDSKETVVPAIDGKTITVNLSMGGTKSYKVRSGSVSYGKVKGETAVRFSEVSTGASRTVTVSSIVSAK
jgi:hypothetical protein